MQLCYNAVALLRDPVKVVDVHDLLQPHKVLSRLQVSKLGPDCSKTAPDGGLLPYSMLTLELCWLQQVHVHATKPGVKPFLTH